MNAKFVHMGRLAENGVRAKGKTLCFRRDGNGFASKSPQGHFSFTPGFSPVMGRGENSEPF